MDITMTAGFTVNALLSALVVYATRHGVLESRVGKDSVNALFYVFLVPSFTVLFCIFIVAVWVT
ncbi:hypothetical protein OK016_17090 [Vibrio chagasii]|nr:hypothetical protein [Vibrio chagasii]